MTRRLALRRTVVRHLTSGQLAAAAGGSLWTNNPTVAQQSVGCVPPPRVGISNDPATGISGG